IFPPHTRSTLFPYTTLFRSSELGCEADAAGLSQPLERPIGCSMQKPHSSGRWLGGGNRRRAMKSDCNHAVLDPTFARLTLHQNRSEEHTSELQSRFDLVCRL